MQYLPCCVRTIWFYFRHSTLMWARDPTGRVSVDSGPVLTGKEPEPNLTGPGGRVSQAMLIVELWRNKAIFRCCGFTFIQSGSYSRVSSSWVVLYQMMSRSLAFVMVFCPSVSCADFFRCYAARQTLSGSQVSVGTSLIF